MAWLAAYGLFLAKTATLVLALLVVLIMIFALSNKKKADPGTVQIEHLSEKMRQLKKDAQQTLCLDKQAKKALLKAEKAEKKAEAKRAKQADTATTQKPRLFVIRFEGDIRASQVTGLRACINTLLQVATPEDKVLVTVDSAGGLVHSYGLAASQLKRIRDHALPLTVAIDKVAASGGYLMAAIAQHIIAAPFAIIGSIGVIAQVPNFHRLLNKHHIDFEQHTAGKYKRTLTVFGKNSNAAREKFQADLAQTHDLFKNFVNTHRPQLDMDTVATGEHWHGADAIALKLIDELQTSDDFLYQHLETHHVFEISYNEKKALKEKLGLCANHIADVLSQWRFMK